MPSIRCCRVRLLRGVLARHTGFHTGHLKPEFYLGGGEVRWSLEWPSSRWSWLEQGFPVKRRGVLSTLLQRSFRPIPMEPHRGVGTHSRMPLTEAPNARYGHILQNEPLIWRHAWNWIRQTTARKAVEPILRLNLVGGQLLARNESYPRDRGILAAERLWVTSKLA